MQSYCGIGAKKGNTRMSVSCERKSWLENCASAAACNLSSTCSRMRATGDTGSGLRCAQSRSPLIGARPFGEGCTTRGLDRGLRRGGCECVCPLFFFFLLFVPPSQKMVHGLHPATLFQPLVVGQVLGSDGSLPNTSHCTTVRYSTPR